MKQFLFVTLIVLSTQLSAEDKIPVGTILPVQLNSSLRSNKARVGQQINARVMQDVPLPGERKIHAGAKVIGHIVSARPAVNGMMADLSFRFDMLAMGKRRVPMITNLRALATVIGVTKRTRQAAQVELEDPQGRLPHGHSTETSRAGSIAIARTPRATSQH